jgi:D-alanyl-D-alanine carboxypeptidase
MKTATTKVARPIFLMRLRYLFVWFLSISVLANVARAQSAQAYAIVDAKTGYILQAREGDDKRAVGSLTKIATALVVLDWAERTGGDLNQAAVIPPEALVNSGVNLAGFQPGDVIALRDLLYAALVESNNIAAFTLAAYVGEKIGTTMPARRGELSSITAFVAQMNALAKTQNMLRTRFLNPTGQDAKEKPYSTAFDMAKLTRYAMQKASFRFYVSQKTREISFTRAGETKTVTLRNTNELLGTEGVDGVKTGRTNRAGDCLVLHAVRDPEVVKEGERTIVTPRQLIIVLLGSSNRFTDGKMLLERGWGLYDQWAAAGRMADPKSILR